jgi:hypothetical protein
MNERELIKTLRERSAEQEKLKSNMPFPRVFAYTNSLFGNNPWRILIPTAFIITVILHLAIGKPYDEFILKLFGEI